MILTRQVLKAGRLGPCHRQSKKWGTSRLSPCFGYNILGEDGTLLESSATVYWHWATVGTAPDNSSAGGWLQDTWSYLKRVPWSVSFTEPIIPVVPMVAGIGPALSLSYIPASKTFCIAPGAGVATLGKAANCGPLLLGDVNNARNILSGSSWNAGIQATAFLRAQATTDSSGTLAGPTFGTPGASFTWTYGFCTK